MVGFAAGGTVDTIARILANALAPILGQNVIVENRPGGSASIAATQVVIAEPDGHTLLFGVFCHAVAPALAKLSYDTQKDLTAVSQVAGVPLFMFAAGKSPFGSVADAVAAAKAAPNTVSYATGGAGSSGASRGGTVRAPRRRDAGACAVPRQPAGDPVAHLRRRAAALGYADRGDARLYRAEADEGARRDDARAAAGIPGYPGDRRSGARRRSRRAGLAGRAGARRHAAGDDRDAAQGDRAGDDSARHQARIEAMSVEPMATDPAAFDTFFKSEVTRWTEVANRAGLTVQ